MKKITKKTLKKPANDIERLAFFIRSIDMNFENFESAIGVSNGYIGKQVKRKAGIGSKILLKVSIKYPDLNIMWVITGRHSMILENNNDDLLMIA